MELREMVPERLNDTEYPIPRNADRGGLFRCVEAPDISFPIQSVRIDWDRLIAKRPLILETVDQMPVYLLKPEVLGLLDAEKDPTYRLTGRPSKAALQRSPKRYVPIVDLLLQDRIQSYLYAGRFKKIERIFPMARQTVNRHIQALVERVGGAEFAISSHTFRHSFAVHLLLHGRPLKVVSQLLGHRSIDSTEIYTNVLTVDAEHFLDGVDFH